MRTARSWRRLVLGVLLMVCPDQTTQAQTYLDTTVGSIAIPKQLGPCELHDQLAHFALVMQFPLGFEQGFVGCARAVSNSETVEQSGLSVREVLNQLVAQVPAYAWRDMNGVVVVRPQLEWDDAAEFMNMEQQVPAFKASAEHLGPAYRALSVPFLPRAFPDNDRWLVNSKRELPDFQIDFSGGSLLEALNAFVRARAEFSWVVRYCTATTTTVDNANLSIAATRLDMTGRPSAVTIPVVDREHPGKCGGR